MKKTVPIILLSCVLLLLSVLIILGYDQISSETKISISAEIISNDCLETVTCWQDENGDYYLFIPGYADLSQVYLHKGASYDFFLDGIPLTEGMAVEALQLDHAYTLAYTIYGKEKSVSLTIARSGGVPTMYIDTFSGSMEYIHQEKNNQESASMRLYDANGNLCNTANIEEMSGRGNSTWETSDKKPYSLCFASETDLLEMGAAKRWILLANVLDESHLRNKLVYDFASEFGLNYSPDSKWIDLYLNGNYVGVYLLCERNEVHENRVNISGDNVNLVSLELESRLENRNLNYFQTEAKQVLRVHYPLDASTDTVASINNAWQSVENALSSPDGIDRVTGKSWQELIDIESWSRKYLIEEVFGNLDGGYISQYFYMDENGKAFAGPVWDYDYAIGNDIMWQLTASNIQLVNKSHVHTNQYRVWFYALWQKEEFRNCVFSMYESEFVPLLEDILSKNTEEYVNCLSQAATLNSIRWPGRQNWSEAVNQVVGYMNERIEFFHELWLTNTEFYTVCLRNRGAENNSYRMVVRGETVSDLPILEGNEYENFLGWYYEDTNQPFDPSTPIFEDTNLYAKWETVLPESTTPSIKIIPIGVITIMFFVLLFVDVKRNIIRKGRG